MDLGFANRQPDTVMSTSANPNYGIIGGTAAGGVSLQPKTIAHLGGSATRTAGIAFLADGTMTWPRTFTNVALNPVTDWIIPNTAASAAYYVRLTNLTWVLKDEGFAVSPSGGTYTQPMPAGPYAADSDGDEDVWFNLGTDRYWVFIDDDSSVDPVGTQHATFDLQIALGPGTSILATAAMDWHVSSEAGGGGGGGGCFEIGTQFRMADGSLKEVQNIMPGDIMEEGGKVYQAIVGDGSVEDWYNVDGVLVTGTHTIYNDGAWMHVANAGYDRVPAIDKYYVVANQNHKMVAENGQLFTDFQEVDYMSTGWDDWVIKKLNGETNDETMRQLINTSAEQS